MCVMFPYRNVMQMFQAASEVENMKSQMMTLFKELQQAQSKLDEAEGMKKNLQDRLGPHTHRPTLSNLANHLVKEMTKGITFNILYRLDL